ncbi:MAG TPA: tRNA (adenosine(37)-N6)-dimethylallyltransferase MiaA [Dehalococcoidia bacterium]|nr:tRNA (adenosine(37)-N6)-dimethylallyltransferase MiaA [Dehalococcoidia bacterium]
MSDRGVTRCLVAIVGPTATGKSALAIALAQRFQGEVVNADSRQVYAGMDIGTAKPTPQERRQVPHHLFDIARPDEPFSLGRWLDLARQTLEDIWQRGRLPVLVGGTGQYVWALLEGWTVPRVPPRPDLRRHLEERARREGVQALYAELAGRDPAATAFVDPRNVRRVVRALEVMEATGRPFSEQRRRIGAPFPYLAIGLWLPRQELYRRIDQRVEEMVRQGLVDEVRKLLAQGFSPELPAMSSIGYREMCQHLQGKLTLPEAVERIKTGTHRLVRHQENWFRRSDPRIRWLRADDPRLLEEASRLVAQFLATREEAVSCAS